MIWPFSIWPFNQGRGEQDWMCTASGVQYFPANPRAKDVRIKDIAHHLSRLCRYTGAVNVEHYSVAEHSVLVSLVVPPEHAFAGLMHDAPEAYTNDLSRPLKRSLPDYKRVEAKNWKVIASVFDLPLKLPAAVHLADRAVFRSEQIALMPPLPADQGLGFIEPAKIAIRGLSPNKAKDLFLNRYYELTTGVGAAARHRRQLYRFRASPA